MWYICGVVFVCCVCVHMFSQWLPHTSTQSFSSEIAAETSWDLHMVLHKTEWLDLPRLQLILPAYWAAQV